MSTRKEDLMQKALESFTAALQSSLPLEHFSQFHNESDLNTLAQKRAKEVLVDFQKDTDLSFEESCLLVPEIFQKFQKKIEEWKGKNEANKSKCEHFLQSQVDFLLADFSASVVIKLVSAPDFALQDLTTFLEHRKIVLVDIFEKLSKPGEPQSIANMKTRLEEKLEYVQMETIEMQRLHLEDKASHMAKKVLKDAKEIVLELAREVKSELEAFKGQSPKNLVKEKLEEIDVCLRKKCKMLEEYHPSIYSAVLQTTAEIRKCLQEKDYQDMSPEEFAESLHEQLLFDFDEENHISGNTNETELNSINSSDGKERARETSGNTYTADEVLILSLRNEVFVNNNGTQPWQHNEVTVDFPKHEILDDKEEEDEMDEDSCGMGALISNSGAVMNLAAETSEEEGQKDMEESSNKSSQYKLRSGHGRPKQSKRKRTDESDYEGMSAEESADTLHEQRLDDFARRNHVGRNQRETNKDSVCLSESSENEEDEIQRKDNEAAPTHDQLGDDDGKDDDESIILKAHKRAQTRGFRIVCKECKLSFVSRKHLHEHTKIKHEGKLPLGCRYCDERFGDVYALKNHVIVHADLRPFRCPTCENSFNSKYKLERHIQGVHSQSRQSAKMLANDAARAYLVKETKDESCREIPERNINGRVVSHVIKKAKLKFPK